MLSKNAGSLCAYYGARAALPEADLVLVPYGALLTEVRLKVLSSGSTSRVRSKSRLGVQEQGSKPSC